MKKLEKTIDDLENSLNKLTVDEIKNTPVTEPEPQTLLTNKEIADSMNIRYIEPIRKLQPFGTCPQQLKKDRDHDWEYVKAIYENYDDIGECAEFWLSKYPGDPDCLWRIPANVPVFVPRMVAKHLSEIQKYHIFDYGAKPNQEILKHGDFTHEFHVKETKYRGKMRPLGVYF